MKIAKNMVEDNFTTWKITIKERFVTISENFPFLELITLIN